MLGEAPAAAPAEQLPPSQVEHNTAANIIQSVALGVLGEAPPQVTPAPPAAPPAEEKLRWRVRVESVKLGGPPAAGRTWGEATDSPPDTRSEELEAEVGRLRTANAALEERNATLEARLAAIEQQLTGWR